MSGKKIMLTVIALALIVVSLFAYGQKVLAYNVVIGGEVVGQLKDAEVLEEAIADFKSKKENEIGQVVNEAVNIELKRAQIDEKLLVKDVNELVEKKVVFTTKAFSLVVDGKPLFSMLHKEDLENLLKQYKAQFLTSVDKNAKVESLVFEENVRIVSDQVTLNSIVSMEEAKRKLFTMKEEPVIYEVEKGDSFWLIARENKTAVADLIRLNPELDPEKIWPGDKVVIKPGKPMLDVIATLKNTIIEDIPYETQYKKDSSMLSRDRKVINPGKNGEKEVQYLMVLKNGYQESLEVLNEKVLKEPVTRVVKVGTKKTISRGVRRNYGVVQGKRVSSNFGWRTHPITGRRSFHDGVDIAASYGNGAYAYSSGTVTFAGWNGGYGKVVYIDHGNGLQTRYAHLSKIYVRKGQQVSAGQKIGAVGSTGNSTGPHLHFEVRKNGTPQNPFNYI